MKKKLLCSLLTALPLLCMAQELNENVEVEGIYRPDIIKGERFNVFPEHQTLELPEKTLGADVESTPAAFTAEAMKIDIIGWRVGLANTPRGYVDLSLGSMLNSSLSAGYSILRREDTRLNVSLQHNSTSLWKPYKNLYPDLSRRYRYDENVALSFSRLFKGKGMMEADMQYRLGAFNYYSYIPVEADTKAPAQTLNDFAFRAGFNTLPGLSSSWHANLLIRHFAMRSLYLPKDQSLTTCKGDRETRIGLYGGYSKTWTSESKAGIDGTFDLYLYSKDEARSGIVDTPPTYGIFNITPYYSFLRNELSVKAGINLILAFNASGDSPESHFSAFHVSPDVRIDWRKNKAGVYLHFLGSVEATTLAGMADHNYYTMPALAYSQPVYTPIDGRIGLQAGPFSGFSAGIEFAFRVTKHLPFGGWYAALLNRDSRTLNILGSPQMAVNELATPLYSLATWGNDIHGWRAELNAKYQHTFFSIGARAAYMPQKGSRGWSDGFRRSRWEIGADLKLQPIKPFEMGISYKYSGVCAIDLPWQIEHPGIAEASRKGVSSVRLSDIAMLNASASWKFNPRLKVGVCAYNLLNRRIDILPELPGEGIDVQGCISFTF